MNESVLDIIYGLADPIIEPEELSELETLEAE
jgi:hypothetical protein